MGKAGTEDIFVYSPFFYPEQISTGKYNTHLVEELVKKGCNVKVFASHPLYPDWQPKKSSASISGVEIYRGGGWLKYPKQSMMRRVVLEIWFACSTLIRYFISGKTPDIVIPVFPPSLFFLLLNWLMPSSVCRVGIVHDLQGVYAARDHGVIGGILKGAIHFVEKRCFKGCDSLIFLSTSMANKAIGEYKIDAARCVVCYPFVSISECMSISVALDSVLLSDSFNVVYSGALGEKQNPDGLLLFMNEIASDQSDVACHIFSAGPIFERLRVANEGAQNCRVQFHDLVPAEQLAELYDRSDVQIVPQAFNTSDGSLPSKLPNLLAAGVPVFVICESGSELGDLVNDAEAGVVVNTWNIAELVEQFSSCKNKLGKESKHDRRMRLQAFVKAKFSIDCVVASVLIAAKNKREGGQ